MNSLAPADSSCLMCDSILATIVSELAVPYKKSLPPAQSETTSLGLIDD